MGKATREAYGNALAKIGKENSNIIVLDADLSKSTKTDTFKKECPERFFNAGIAEQNLISVGAGLAAAGKIPFVSSFAMFATGRAFEQIRNAVCYPKLNVKVCATHAGITVGEDGATHQSLEDIACMRVLPNMTVIVPADEKDMHFFICRNSRACQDKLSHIMPMVNLKSDGIPKFGCQLPFINKSWRITLQQDRSINLCHL